jgi:uncharacterized protein (DUF1330 family)
MAKGYWIVAYRAVHDAEKLAAYGRLAAPAIQAAGGRLLVRGGAIEAHEAGLRERTVVVEYESFEHARAARASAAYQDALRVLGDGAERDFRIVEGV